MKTLEALYFPGTAMFSASQFPVFLLFEKLHLLHPVENDDSLPPNEDIFTTAGLCQAHTPSPLGEERERFIHLVRDIRERKDDYAAQLANLTVAGLTSKKSSIEDSSRSIAANLMGKPAEQIEEEEEDTRESSLWQARLSLKIAEQLEKEEEEVAVELALLGDDESDLFKSLKGELDEEEETLFEELLQLKNSMNKPSGSSIASRLKAWSTLFISGDAPLLTTFLTHTEEAADSLLEEYVNRMQLEPEIFLKLELPANIGWDGDQAVADIAAFKQKSRALLDQLDAYLAESKQELRQVLESQWGQIIEENFPEETTGRVDLCFYKMAGITTTALLGKDDAGGTTMAVVRWRE